MTDNVKKITKESARKLGTNGLKLAEHVRAVYRCNPVVGTTVEEVLNPFYWAHVAQKLKPQSVIEAVFADGSTFLELFVLEANKLSARVVLMREVDLTGKNKKTVSEVAADDEAVDDYKITWRGPVKKHSVLRVEDNIVIKDEFASKKDAEDWLEDYKRAQAA